MSDVPKRTRDTRKRSFNAVKMLFCVYTLLGVPDTKKERKKFRELKNGEGM